LIAQQQQCLKLCKELKNDYQLLSLFVKATDPSVINLKSLSTIHQELLNIYQLPFDQEIQLYLKNFFIISLLQENKAIQLIELILEAINMERFIQVESHFSSSRLVKTASTEANLDIIEQFNAYYKNNKENFFTMLAKYDFSMINLECVFMLLFFYCIDMHITLQNSKDSLNYYNLNMWIKTATKASQQLFSGNIWSEEELENSWLDYPRREEGFLPPITNKEISTKLSKINAQRKQGGHKKNVQKNEELKKYAIERYKEEKSKNNSLNLKKLSERIYDELVNIHSPAKNTNQPVPLSEERGPRTIK